MTTLYTWQNPEWDITTQKRDSSKGILSWKEDTWPKLQQLYKKLEKKVKTSDFVWCLTEYEYWMDGDDRRRLWELKVPDLKIFKFLELGIWEEMLTCIDDNRQPSSDLWSRLIMEKNEGIQKLSTGNITPLVLVPLDPSIEIYDHRKCSTGKSDNLRYEKLPTCDFELKRSRANPEKLP